MNVAQIFLLRNELLTVDFLFCKFHPFLFFKVKVYDDIQEELKVKTEALKKSKLRVRLGLFIWWDFKFTINEWCFFLIQNFDILYVPYKSKMSKTVEEVVNLDLSKFIQSYSQLLSSEKMFHSINFNSRLKKSKI